MNRGENNTLALVMYYIADACETRMAFLCGQRNYEKFYSMLTPLVCNPFLTPNDKEWTLVTDYCASIQVDYREELVSRNLIDKSFLMHVIRHSVTATATPDVDRLLMTRGKDIRTLDGLIEYRQLVDRLDGCFARLRLDTKFSGGPCTFAIPYVRVPAPDCRPPNQRCGSAWRGGDELADRLFREIECATKTLYHYWLSSRAHYQRINDGHGLGTLPLVNVAPGSKIAGEYMAYLSHLGKAAILMARRGHDPQRHDVDTVNHDIVTNVERGIRHLRQASLDCLKDAIATVVCCKTEGLKLPDDLVRHAMFLRAREHDQVGGPVGAYPMYEELLNDIWSRCGIVPVSFDTDQP